MEEENKEIRIECVSEFPNYGKVAFLIRVVDGGSVTKFSNHRLAKDTYLLEKKLGNKNITYQERLACVVEKFPGEKKEDIAQRITKGFEGHNTTFKK